MSSNSFQQLLQGWWKNSSVFFNKLKSWWTKCWVVKFFAGIRRLPDHLVNLESHRTLSTNQPSLDVNSLNCLPSCLIPLVTWAYLCCTGDAGRCLKRFTTPTSRHWMSCYLRSRESDSAEHEAMTAKAVSYKMRRTPTCSELGGNHAVLGASNFGWLDFQIAVDR